MRSVTLNTLSKLVDTNSAWLPRRMSVAIATQFLPRMAITLPPLYSIILTASAFPTYSLIPNDVVGGERALRGGPITYGPRDSNAPTWRAGRVGVLWRHEGAHAEDDGRR